MTTTPPKQSPPPPAKPPVSPPATVPPARQLSVEEVQKGIELMQKYAYQQRELGRAERAWHLQAVEFYKGEAEVSKFDAELRKKYNMQPDETFDFVTGKIAKRTR
jgi:hypothetical protein